MSRSWKRMSIGLKLAIGATVILALSVVGVLAAERFDAKQARDTSASRAAEKLDHVKAAGKPLALGTVTKISDNYRVSVAEVTRYEIPTGWLVVPTVRVTYIGHEDGEPWADLNVEFFGSRSRSYGESDCPAGVGDGGGSDRPTLANGGDETYEVCIEVPDKEAKGGKILVEEAFSTDDRTFWSIKGAVTKTLPSPPPQLSAGRNPAPQPQGQRRNYGNSDSDSDDACEKYEDDVRKYKDHIDELDKLAEQADSDDKEEYEEWKDAMDANVDRYEKACG